MRFVEHISNFNRKDILPTISSLPFIDLSDFTEIIRHRIPFFPLYFITFFPQFSKWRILGIYFVEVIVLVYINIWLGNTRESDCKSINQRRKFPEFFLFSQYMQSSTSATASIFMKTREAFSFLDI